MEICDRTVDGLLVIMLEDKYKNNKYYDNDMLYTPKHSIYGRDSSVQLDH